MERSTVEPVSRAGGLPQLPDNLEWRTVDGRKRIKRKAGVAANRRGRTASSTGGVAAAQAQLRRLELAQEELQLDAPARSPR